MIRGEIKKNKNKQREKAAVGRRRRDNLGQIVQHADPVCRHTHTHTRTLSLSVNRTACTYVRS